MASRRPPLGSYGTGLDDAVLLLPCRPFSMSLVRPGQDHGGSRLAASSPVDYSIGQVGRQERHGSGMLHIALERWSSLMVTESAQMKYIDIQAQELINQSINPSTS